MKKIAFVSIGLVFGSIMLFNSNLLCKRKEQVINFMISKCESKEELKNMFCKYCNEINSLDSARVIFFSKDTLCTSKLLLNPLPPNTQPHMLQDTFPDNCGSPAAGQMYLAGYYLQPFYSLGSPSNKMQFTPIWLYSGNGQTIQINGDSIVVGPDEISLPTVNSNTLITSIPTPNLTFNHNVLQFHPDIVILDKTFISYYELKMILENCEFLGITGALVNRGNIEVGQTLNTVTNQGIEEYFTYRLIGYKPVSSSGLINFPKETTQNLNNLRLPANINTIKFSNGSVVMVDFDITIPTETWATPCPPMWYNDN